MPSILETFYILFESNADKVEKGANQATRAGQGLEENLGAIDRQAAALGSNLVSTFGAVGAAIAAVFSVTRVADFIKTTAELNAQLGVTAERLGIDVSDLDAWQQATQRAGGSAEGFTQTLDFLNRGMADIATKGTSRLKPFFDELKIKVTDAPKHVRPLLDILGDLADKLSKLDAGQRAGIAEKLGIDEGTVLMLAQGRRGVDDLVARQKALGVATKEDTEAAHKFDIAVQDLQQRLKKIATQISTEILPALDGFFRWLGKIVDYLSQHKALVIDFFTATAGVIGTIFLPQLEKAIVVTAGFIAEWLLVPALVLAVGAAIALVVDDVQNFLKGNRSVIGELSKSWPEFGRTVRSSVTEAGSAWQWFIDLQKAGYGLQWNILKLIGAAFVGLLKEVGSFASSGGRFLSQFTQGLANVFPFWAQVFGSIGHLIQWVIGLLEELVSWYGKLAASAIKVLPKALTNWSGQIAGVTAVLSGTAGAPAPAYAAPSLSQQALQAAKQTIQHADGTPLGSSSILNRNNSVAKEYHVTTGPVTINVPSGDPAAIMKAFNDNLDKAMRQALDHFDDGVAS